MIQQLCPELERAAPGELDARRGPEPFWHVVRLGGPDGERRVPGMWVWSEMLERSREIAPEALAARQADQEFDDPINIQYTSGTTGNPKGATLSHHNILNNGYFVTRLQGITEQDRLCVPVPLYHCFGCVMGNLGAFSCGAALIYPAESYEAGAVLQAVQEERCTVLYGVPTMFIGELEHPDFDKYDYTSLRTGVMAGSPCPIEVMRKVMDRMHMRDVEICYGMTETSPVSTQSRLDDSIERRVSTVGRVHPHVEIKIVDPATGKVLPAGQPGELCTRGYSVMLGYWDNEEATRQAIDHASVDAYWRPGYHGRRWLHQHRRSHQRHGHPRRREHLSARGRGIPLHASKDQRRPGDRRPRRQVRRGTDGLGQAEERRDCDLRGTDRILSRQDRHSQDSPLLEVCRCVSHDRHRENTKASSCAKRRSRSLAYRKLRPPGPRSFRQPRRPWWRNW